MCAGTGVQTGTDRGAVHGPRPHQQLLRGAVWVQPRVPGRVVHRRQPGVTGRPVPGQERHSHKPGHQRLAVPVAGPTAVSGRGSRTGQSDRPRRVHGVTVVRALPLANAPPHYIINIIKMIRSRRRLSYDAIFVHENRLIFKIFFFQTFSIIIMIFHSTRLVVCCY